MVKYNFSDFINIKIDIRYKEPIFLKKIEISSNILQIKLYKMLQKRIMQILLCEQLLFSNSTSQEEICYLWHLCRGSPWVLRNKLLTTESVMPFLHHLELGKAASLCWASDDSSKNQREWGELFQYGQPASSS